jgi:hypothetical protein
MKNITTFETARALKEVGFPQPEPEYLQVWYEEFNPFVEGWSREDSRHIIGIGRFEIWHEDFDMSEYYFAPTATEILKQMPMKSLTFFLGDGIDDPWWQVEFFDEIEPNGTMLAEHTNPAEACAAAYLEIKKTPQP